MKLQEMKQEIATVIQDLENHSRLMSNVVEGLKKTIQYDANITTLDDLRKALGTFTKARKDVERAKSVVKARVQERIKG